ncbi:MAG: hypothetical protein AAF570_00940 [Bacteroidota bacterium]
MNAQVDVTNARANPKTFIFDDDKHTVHGYIYSTLKEKSSCCGNDAIYLEVKFDGTGSVTSAKTLTGKNDCYKKSVVDIVKSVRWNAEGVSGTKTIYFEVKPIIPCSGSPGENEYKNIPVVGGGAVASNGGMESSNESGTGSVVEEVVEETVTTTKEETEEVAMETKEEAEEVVEEVATNTKEEAEEVVEEVAMESKEEVEEVAMNTKEEVEEVKENNAGGWTGDSFLSEESSEETAMGKDAIKNNSAPTGKDIVKGHTAPTDVVLAGGSSVNKYTGPVKIPPQAKLKYESKGERNPEDAHRGTFVNVPGNKIGNPKYEEGENKFAIHLRQELRKAGYCGLAQAAVELEIDPNGSVVNSRVLMANDDKIREIVPTILSGLKFQPQGMGVNYRSIHQFKTEIVCKGQSPKYEDLDDVPNLIKVN